MQLDPGTWSLLCTMFYVHRPDMVHDLLFLTSLLLWPVGPNKFYLCSIWKQTSQWHNLTHLIFPSSTSHFTSSKLPQILIQLNILPFKFIIPFQKHVCQKPSVCQCEVTEVTYLDSNHKNTTPETHLQLMTCWSRVDFEILQWKAEVSKHMGELYSTLSILPIICTSKSHISGKPSPNLL